MYAAINSNRPKHELETTLTYNPDYRVARLTLAALQNRTGAVSAAMINGIRLVKNNPRDVPALLVYSESLIASKDYERAAKVLKMAADNAANNADIHRQLGVLDLAKKNVAAALKEFRIAWEMDPGSKQLMDHVVLGFVVERQTGSAIELLQQAVAARPKDATAADRVGPDVFLGREACGRYRRVTSCNASGAIQS